MAGFVEGPQRDSFVSREYINIRSADVATATEGPQIHLKFAPYLVEQAFEEAIAGDITQEEATYMSSGVDFIYRHVSRQWPKDTGEREGKSREVGFAVAHRVLRYAARDAGITLPTVRDETAEDFEAHMRENPYLLFPWFFRDYAIHESVTELVSGFTNSHSQFGAQLAFGIYGRLANPDRGAINIPSREPVKAEHVAVVIPGQTAAEVMPHSVDLLVRPRTSSGAGRTGGVRRPSRRRS